MQKASLLKRLIAFSIDLLILNSILLWPFNILLLKNFPDLQKTSLTSILSTDLAAIIFFMGIVILLYFTLFEYKYQQTIGKYFVRIKISEKKNFSSLLLSNVIFIPTIPFLLLAIVDVIYLIFNPNNQRLTEKFLKINNVDATFN